jgi:hypothetical protein
LDGKSFLCIFFKVNSILLLLSASDTDNLASAAQRILTDGTTHVWILASPAVTVSTKEATAAIEEEIVGITKLMDAAANRKDFAGADGYKKQLEAKQLDRAGAISSAYKKVEKEVREKAFLEGPLQAFIEPLRTAGLSIKLRYLEDHHDATDLPNLLKKYEQVAPFTPGSYGVRFGRTYSSPKVPSGNNVPAPVAPPERLSAEKPPVPVAPVIDKTKAFTGAELEAMHHFTLAAVAKHHGVFEKGKPKQDTIRDVLNKIAMASV